VLSDRKNKITLAFSLTIDKINEFTGHKSAIYALVYDHIRQQLYSVGGDGWIVSWPISAVVADGKLVANADNKLFSVALSPTKQLLVAGGIDGNLYWIDTNENIILSRSDYHKGSIFDLCFLSSELLLSVSGDGYVCLWDTNTRMPLISKRISQQGLRCIKYDAVYHKIYIGASDNNIYILDETTFEIINIIKNAHQNSIFSIETLGADFIVSGSRDAHFTIWDKNNYNQHASCAAHWYTINKIVEIPEFGAFATASRDKTIRIWDTKSHELLKSIDVIKGGHFHSVNSLIWIPESKYLLSASDDRTIKMFMIGN
jgi:WD repeat-containing protein 61